MKYSLCRRYLLPLLALACSQSETRAALLLYEGFEGYSTSGFLNGQAVSSSAIGFSGIWGGNTASTGAGNINASSLSFGSLLPTSGGSYVNTGGTVVLGSTLSIPSSLSGTIWMSHLIRFNGAHSASGSAGFEVRIGDTAGGSEVVRFRTFSDTRSGTSNVIGTDYNTGTLSTIGDSTDPQLATNTNYIMISSFTNVAGTSGSGTATIWALTTDQFQTMMESPLGAESYLTEATAGQYSAKATNTDAVKSTDQIESGDFLQIVNVGNNIQLDEIRLGTTLADVIPEPGSALLAISGLTFLLRRSRRS
ncbi:hypothetical protein OVA24_14005 [Luteolibacter sp. SL250]|uniref:hypothetical protein n=1 Tax=Luteolibacter sp. SL250 TaxID=2995170 RepID=UPI002271F23B|nr:hypothetical protein [Luteolibacter sp. SL250]WAC18348.1 hypothetical protein OVA24_14005 [Luteolibacter sp. SL250]